MKRSTDNGAILGLSPDAVRADYSKFSWDVPFRAPNTVFT